MKIFAISGGEKTKPIQSQTKPIFDDILTELADDKHRFFVRCDRGK